MDDRISAALWERATSKCSCGRQRYSVDANAPTVCKGCGNYPWNCHCPLVDHQSTAEPEPPPPDLDEDEIEF